MDVFVQFLMPDGSRQTASPGGIVGRSYAASVRIDDGRVSEAHALVSLRGQEMVLVPLRGRLRVNELAVERVVLRAGLVVELARGLTLTVADVGLPEQVLAVEGQGPARSTIPRQVLAGVLSLCTEPAPHLVEGVSKDARALIFSDGLSWFVREGDAALALRTGMERVVAGVTLQFMDVPVGGAAVRETVPDPAARPQPLRIVSHFDVVQVSARGMERHVVLAGIAARVFSELLAFRAPVRWQLVARAVWGNGDDAALRHRLDVTLQKIRRRLAELRVGRELIRAHGTGQLELVLISEDEIDDHA